MERIEVGYSDIKGFPAKHKFLVYTNNANQRFAIRAGPTTSDVGTALQASTFSGGVSGSPGSGGWPYGRLKVEPVRTYDNTYIDYQADNFFELIATGEDLSAKWQNIVSNANFIRSAEYGYNVWSQNSNTFVDELLVRAGLPQPKWDDRWLFNLSTDNSSGFFAPGSGNRLSNPTYLDPGEGMGPASFSLLPSERTMTSVNVFTSGSLDSTLVIDLGGGVITAVGLHRSSTAPDALVEVVSQSFGNPETGQAITVRPGSGLRVAPARQANGLFNWAAVDWDGAGVAATSQLGSIFASQVFGSRGAAAQLGSTIVGQITSHAAAELLATLGSESEAVHAIADRTFREFGIDLASAGVGAVTSYLTAELVSELGIKGFAGEALSASVGYGVATIASNITARALGSSIPWNKGLEGANLAGFFGSFFGGKLATVIGDFDSIQGQIGSTLGATVGSLILGKALGAALGNFFGPFVGAFVGGLLGGAIGSLFGGNTDPESGTHVIWDAGLKEFRAGTSADAGRAPWRDDGADSSLPSQMAGFVVDYLNAITGTLFDDTVGGVINGSAIGAGAYGQFKNNFSYWAAGENSSTSPDTKHFVDVNDAIDHGLYVTLNKLAVAGGDTFVKRALYRFVSSQTVGSTLDYTTLMGNIGAASDFSELQTNKAVIIGGMALAPDSAFSTGWTLAMLRASELQLAEFFKSDFYGGLGSFVGTGSIGGTRSNPASGAALPVPVPAPSGAAIVNGWDLRYSAETRWSTVAGPDGLPTVAMETGQAAPYNEAGGGAITGQFTIDPTKAYEFTIYVRKKDLTKHSLFFGVSAFGASAYVERLDGIDEINPYFYASTAAQQATLNADKWYKVVGYVLPQGVSSSPVLAQSGVFDATTGTRVAEVTNFRWHPERPGNSVHARFFNFYDHTQAGWSTLWLPPQVRAVDGGVGKGPNLVDTSGWAERQFRDVHIPGDVAPADVGVRFTTDAGIDLRISVAGGDPLPGSAVVDGWNSVAPDFAEEARWTPVSGPDGMPAVAMETGQTGAVDDRGGGALTNAFTIDGTKAYEFTIYVRKHDLAKHSAYFGLSDGGAYVQTLAGANETNPYFYAATASQQQAQGLKDDRWYKIVGYVLPQGASSSPLTAGSGVFDAVSGVKVANVANFRWNASRPSNAVHARFFNFYNASQAGYSTHWLPPQVRAVEGGIASGPNLVDTSGWATINPQDIVIPNFSTTMGYAESGYVSGTFNGSVYSDLLIASGSSRVVFSDSTVATSANGPNVRGPSTLSDDIFIGGVGNDELYGRVGWDWLDGGPGDDRIEGGDGNDVLLGRGGYDRLYGGAGDDQLDGGDGYDYSPVNGDSEYLIGEGGDDTLFTTPDDGPDLLDGGTGVDIVSYRRSLSPVGLTAGGVVYGDTFVGIEGVEGSRFDDTLTAVAAGSRLLGGDGADVLQGAGGADILEGGAGADTIAGAAGVDTVSYASSNAGVNIDLVTGVYSGGHATGDMLSTIENVTGSSFADVIRGQWQSRVDAGRGNDLVMPSGAGIVDGGDGVDTVSYVFANGGITANLGTGVGTDTLKSIEIVVGSSFDDTITGSDLDDRLDGGSGGVDTLTGLAGDDTYILSRTTGSDNVFDEYGGTQFNSYKDGVVLGSGIEAGEGHLWRQNNDSSVLRAGVVDANLGANWLILNNFYTGPKYKIERMYWENGAFVWIDTITKTFAGANGNDTVDGLTDQNNWLSGHRGTDTLNGRNYNDVLVGGVGAFNDTLNGGGGSDQYVFGRDEGRDIVNDTGGVDTLVIAGDVRADEVTFEFVGADLYVGILNPGAAATTASQSSTYVKIVGQANQATSIENVRIGDFETNLAKLVGQATGYSSVPQAPNIRKRIYAKFESGQIGTIAAYDADGDALTYEVIAVTGDGPAFFTSATNNNIWTDGSNLVTTARWTTQDYEIDTVTIRARDDDNNAVTYDVHINWLPDPNGGPVLPIVFDLDGDGVELASPKQSGVEWDINEDGRDDKMGWVKPDDAFLVYDRNKSGTIDNIEELSFVGDREGALTDLGGLAGLDFDRNDVADGKIDSSDLVYAHLSVWHDSNGNGFSEGIELRTLAEVGIASINLTGTPTGNDPRDRKNVVINTGSFTWTDGRQGGFGDVSLGVIYGKPPNDPTTDAETRANGLEIDRLLKGGVRNRRRAGGASSGTSGTVSPIVFDLGGDGIALISIAASTLDLDVDNDGDLDRAGWVAPDDAMLVYDENANGIVDGTSEISMVRHLEGAATDLEGLRAFDSNTNGELDPEDTEFDRFLLWRDGDSNGHSSEGELVSLRAAGLSRLLLAATPDGDRFGGNVIHGTATFEMSDGTRGMVGDVALGYLEATPENVAVAEPAGPTQDGHPVLDGEPVGQVGEPGPAPDAASEALESEPAIGLVAVCESHHPDEMAFGSEATLAAEADAGPRIWREPRNISVRASPGEIGRHAYLTQMMATAADRRSASIHSRTIEGDDFDVVRWSLGREGRLDRYLQLR